LYYENQFCGYFSYDDIHHLLCGYAEDYQKLLINIYDLILTAAIGCTIAGTDAYRLDIDDGGAAYLQQVFSKIPQNEITKTVQESAVELVRHFQCPNGLARYIQNSLPLIASKIEIAAQGNTLDRVFFTPAFPENKPKILFSFGEKMDNEQYRKIIEEIGQCRFSQDKILIIKEHIHSLADLEDVLLDADLTQEEIQSVLRELGLPEIAALLKRYPMIPDVDMITFLDQKQLLMKSLHNFIRGLSQDQQEIIITASAAIEE